MVRDVQAEAVEGKRNRRVGEFLAGIGQGAGLGSLEGGSVTSIKIRLPTELEPSVLLIVRAAAEKGPQIAFIGAFSVVDALLAWRARAAVDGVKWREDIPWEERAGSG